MYLPGNLYTYVLRLQSVTKKGDAGSLVSVTRLGLSIHFFDTLRYAATDLCVCTFAFLPFVCVDIPL